MTKQECNRQYYLKNKEKIKAQVKAYNEANKEYIAIKKKEYTEKNADKVAEYQHAYRIKHRDKARITSEEWRKNNPDKLQQQYLNVDKDHQNKLRRIRYKNNPNKTLELRDIYKRNRETILAANRLWRTNNKDKVNTRNSRARAAKLQRTVAWADDKAIKQVYADCEEINLAARTAGCPSTEKFVVDHEIPLQGKLVSGLHVGANLQIITASENSSKGNKFTPGSWL